MTKISDEEFADKLNRLEKEFKPISEDNARDREVAQKIFDKQTILFNAIREKILAESITRAVSELNELRKKGFRPS